MSLPISDFHKVTEKLQKRCERQGLLQEVTFLDSGRLLSVQRRKLPKSSESNFLKVGEKLQKLKSNFLKVREQLRKFKSNFLKFVQSNFRKVDEQLQTVAKAWNARKKVTFRRVEKQLEN